MWSLRRLLRMPWTAHATNEETLRTAGCERELLNIVKERKVSYLGHILGGVKYYIPKLIPEGKIEERRGPKRKQHSWLRNIRDWCNISHHISKSRIRRSAHFMKSTDNRQRAAKHKA